MSDEVALRVPWLSRDSQLLSSRLRLSSRADFAAIVNMDPEELAEWLSSPESRAVGWKGRDGTDGSDGSDGVVMPLW